MTDNGEKIKISTDAVKQTESNQKVGFWYSSERIQEQPEPSISLERIAKEIIIELDHFGREVDPHDYGLPNYMGNTEKMIELVVNILHKNSLTKE